MDFHQSIFEALDELIALNQVDYDYWYAILYDENHMPIEESLNELNNKKIWQCVADNLPEMYLAGSYND